MRSKAIFSNLIYGIIGIIVYLVLPTALPDGQQCTLTDISRALMAYSGLTKVYDVFLCDTLLFFVQLDTGQLIIAYVIGIIVRLYLVHIQHVCVSKLPERLGSPGKYRCSYAYLEKS